MMEHLAAAPVHRRGLDHRGASCGPLPSLNFRLGRCSEDAAQRMQPALWLGFLLSHLVICSNKSNSTSSDSNSSNSKTVIVIKVIAIMRFKDALVLSDLFKDA